MSRWFLLAALVPVLLLAVLFGGDEVDERLPARSGGELRVAVVLGSGLAFDKGALVITSHDEDEVHVVVESSGWGRYAVEVEVEETPSGVRVEAEVEGFLHWLFGGPTVDVTVAVPAEYAVDASIDGGPLRIEDLTGSVVARVAGGQGTIRPVDLAVHRVEGRVRLASAGHDIEAEDVTGSLEIETAGGSVDVAGVRGPVRVTSEGGKIELEDVDGDVVIETKRGRVEVDDVRGEVLARSERGGIAVEFLGSPSGRLETERGSIHVSVPRGAPFELVAHTGRGRVEVDSDLALIAAAGEAGGGAGDPGAPGREIAADVERSVKRFVQRGFDTGDWTWHQPEGWGQWHEHSWDRSWQERRRGFGARRAQHVVGHVGAGGPRLHVRTERGAIEISER